jgi:hypothetical protein
VFTHLDGPRVPLDRMTLGSAPPTFTNKVRKINVIIIKIGLLYYYSLLFIRFYSIIVIIVLAVES